MQTSMLLAVLFLPPSPSDGPVIRVPRSWILEKERSISSLTEAEVVALFGEPDFRCYSSWCSAWSYVESGISLSWESPAVLVCPGRRLDPEVIRYAWACLPSRFRPLMHLPCVAFAPRSSLLGVTWSSSLMSCEWRFDRDVVPSDRFAFHWQPWSR